MRDRLRFWWLARRCGWEFHGWVSDRWGRVSVIAVAVILVSGGSFLPNIAKWLERWRPVAWALFGLLALAYVGEGAYRAAKPGRAAPLPAGAGAGLFERTVAAISTAPLANAVTIGRTEVSVSGSAATVWATIQPPSGNLTSPPGASWRVNENPPPLADGNAAPRTLRPENDIALWDYRRSPTISETDQM